MAQLIEKTGILALGTGTFVYLYHSRRSRGRVLAFTKDDSQELTTTFCPPSSRSEGKAKVPANKAKDGPLVLQLQQVQVFFRHGARTPIHTIPWVPEVNYGADFVTRDHQATMFPYERVSCVDGEPVGWGAYSKKLEAAPLRGGANPGALTSYGKDEMYLLGQRLRDCYRQRLDIATFDSDEVTVLSSNIRRTVESAQSVLAGIYGKEQLIDYATNCGPVKIHITDPCYNILIPDTQDCGVLKKNNHSAMVHPDHIAGFQEEREETEAHILKPREKLLESVTEAQAKIDTILQFYESEGTRCRRMELNKHRQHYQHDPLMEPLLQERAKAIIKVDRFWTDVLNRAPVLCDIITEDDMKALVYLRDIRVEEFEGTLTSGYRVHFYFDKNPYFYNIHLCKEVFTRVNPAAPPSKQTPIKWRPGHRLVPEKPEVEEVVEKEEEVEEPLEEKPRIKYAKPPSCRLPPTEQPEPEKIVPDSLLHWLSAPTIHTQDDIGPAFFGDVWKNPQSLSENEPSVRNPWDQKLNFVFGRDDFMARITHGLPFPGEVRKYRQRLETNATTILYYAMAGSTVETRPIVTRLSAGPLLSEMVEQARKVVCGDQAPKLILYSSHDSTMACFMEALCIWDNKWPPFGADIRLELYKEVNGCSGDYYVRVLYLGKEQRIRGQTESYMHWGDFCGAVRKFIIRREEKERICRSNILERITQGVLRPDKAEVDSSETKKETEETPAGM